MVWHVYRYILLVDDNLSAIVYLSQVLQILYNNASKAFSYCVTKSRMSFINGVVYEQMIFYRPDKLYK